MEGHLVADVVWDVVQVSAVPLGMITSVSPARALRAPSA
jgi:hypothetical protein